MDSKFFTFIKPYLAFLDKGDLFRKPFSWFYVFIGGLNLLIPVTVLIAAIKNDIFKFPASAIVLFLILMVFFIITGWINFQIWWDRKTKVLETSASNDEFVATQAFSHFLQTAGESFGVWIGVIGFVFALLTTLFMSKDAYLFSRMLPDFLFLKTGLFYIILAPVQGFLIVLFTRFLAEQIRVFASIANNTKNK